MTRARDFPLKAISVGAARRFADEVLRGLPTEALEAVRLMVSELATNSIRHAKTGFHLVINRRGDSVRIEVTDLAGGIPAVLSPGPTDPTGRGLAIVEMLSDAWGVDYLTASDKTVWFTLAWERRAVCAHR